MWCCGHRHKACSKRAGHLLTYNQQLTCAWFIWLECTINNEKMGGPISLNYNNLIWYLNIFDTTNGYYFLIYIYTLGNPLYCLIGHVQQLATLSCAGLWCMWSNRKWFRALGLIVTPLILKHYKLPWVFHHWSIQALKLLHRILVGGLCVPIYWSAVCGAQAGRGDC